MQEIIEQRRWDAKKFDTGRRQLNSDGVTEDIIYASIFQNGLHDIEPDGSFVDVDTLSEPYEVGVSTDKIIRSRAGEVRYSDTGSTSKQLAKIKTKRGKGVSLKLMGYTTYGPFWPTRKEARYTADNGIEVSQVANYKGFNLTLEIANPQTAENVYKFSVKEYGCDYTYEEVDGKIKCQSPDGEDNVWIKALPAIDSTGSEGSVTLRLGGVTAEGYQIIEKVIDPIWLGNAIGLVEVDPSVTIEDGVDGGVINDAGIYYDAPTTNYGSDTRLYINDYFDQGGESQSSAVWVDLSSYNGVTPINGKFILTGATVVGSSYDGTAYKLKVDFVENQITWNDRKTGTAWQTPGMQGVNDRAATKESTYTLPAVGATCDVDLLLGTLTEWVGGTNYGVALVNDTGSSAGYTHVGSAENVSYPIQFYMEYTEGVTGFPFFFDIGHY
jgi:hypothetical protein